VKDAGAEGVLITRLVGRHAGAQINPLAGYYDGYAWAYGYDPAMVSETTTVVLKTTLYGVDPAHLLWSGTTETFEPKPTSIEQQMPEFAKIIIKTLEKHKLII
jgi:hypothetical protein